jgi:hypothetical protein
LGLSILLVGLEVIKKNQINMKNFTCLILLFLSISTFAQGLSKSDLEKELMPLNQKLNSLKSENSKLKSEIGILNRKLSNSFKKVENLNAQTLVNTTAISQTEIALGKKIKESGDKNQGEIKQVSNSLSKNSLYGIIGVLSALLLSAIIFWLLSNKQKSDKTELIDELGKTKLSIEESLVKEFGKQTELIESQLELIEKQNSSTQPIINVEPDHSLALKVASEINLIERNINLMDPKTKGLKQLQASVGKLKDNLSANGYVMPELLGKPFNQGLKVIVSSTIPDENLDEGQEIISKILIPAVLYNEKMIQTAQIEVSVGL